MDVVPGVRREYWGFYTHHNPNSITPGFKNELTQGVTYLLELLGWAAATRLGH